jgi:hypothetical protein
MTLNANWSGTRKSLPEPVNGSCPRPAESPPSHRRLQRPRIASPARAPILRRKEKCARFANSPGTTYFRVIFSRTTFPARAGHCVHSRASLSLQTYGAKTANLMGKSAFRLPSICFECLLIMAETAMLPRIALILWMSSSIVTIILFGLSSLSLSFLQIHTVFMFFFVCLRIFLPKLLGV